MQFGKYLLLDKIAAGGMAELYRAKIIGEEGFEKLVAIKKVLPHLATEDELVKAFVDEARLAAKLHHENIVQIYDFGTMESDHFISMEYLFGKNLRMVVNQAKRKDKPMGLDNILYLVGRVCDGLDYAHKLKDFSGEELTIIHRDISPPNVFITYQGHVKVVDFGIAKAASQSSTTQVGVIKGKLAYMSPEQADGAVIDHRSDIFAVGAVFYELLTNQRMFEGETMQVLSKVREANFVPAQEIVPDLHPCIIAVLDKCLAKDRKQRYQSCGEMLADVEECSFELGLRPSARNMAAYMRDLFGREISREETAIREATQIGAQPALSSGPAPAAGPVAGVEAAEAAVANNGEDMETSSPEDATMLTPSGEEQTSQATAQAKTPEELFQEPYGDEGATETEEAAGSFPETREKEDSRTPDVGGDADRHPVSRKKWVAAGAGGLVLMLVIALLALTGGDDSTTDQVTKPQAATTSPATVIPESPEATPEKAREAVAALQDKNFTLALKLFDEAYPGNRAPARQDVARMYATALTGRAEELRKERPRDAIALLERAVELSAGDHQAHFQLGLAYNSVRQPEKAAAHFEKAARLNPDFADAWYNLGLACHYQKRYDEALEYYERTVEQSPGFFNAVFNMGTIHAMRKEYGAAEEKFARVVELAPPFLDEAYYNLAVVQDLMGKTEKSLHNLEQALMVNPGNKKAKAYLERVSANAS